MLRVLVLEKDKRTAERLKTVLQESGDVLVALVPTMREAFLVVSQLPQDLAIVPLDDAEQLLHSLRSLKPDLKLILTTPDPEQVLPDEYGMVFQGLVHTPELERELPALLKENNTIKEPSQIPSSNDVYSPPSLIRLRKACEEAGVTQNSSPVRLAVLSQAGRVIGYCGSGTETDAMGVAELIKQNWKRGQLTAQIQFLQLSDFYNAQLVYSRSVAGVVLSVVAEPEVPVGDMRKLANKLARILSGGREQKVESEPEYFMTVGRRNGSSPEEGSSSTFAIAWRPIKPLPVVLEKVVQECIIDLAEDNSCRLRHLSVTPELVHLVIGCPAGRTAAWVVFLMKSGINEEIKRQFGTQSSIWQKGFYATESNQPLSKAELQMMLTPS